MKICEKLQQNIRPYRKKAITSWWTKKKQKQSNRIFIDEKLSIKVIVDCRTTD